MNIYRAAIRQYDRAMAKWDRRIATASSEQVEKVKLKATKAEEAWDIVLKSVLAYHEDPTRRDELTKAYVHLQLAYKQLAYKYVLWSLPSDKFSTKVTVHILSHPMTIPEEMVLFKLLKLRSDDIDGFND